MLCSWMDTDKSIFLIVLSRVPCLPLNTVKHSAVAADPVCDFGIIEQVSLTSLLPHPSFPLKLCFAQTQWDYTGPWWRIGQMKRKRRGGQCGGTRMWWIRGLMSHKHCDTVRWRFGRKWRERRSWLQTLCFSRNTYHYQLFPKSTRFEINFWPSRQPLISVHCNLQSTLDEIQGFAELSHVCVEIGFLCCGDKSGVSFKCCVGFIPSKEEHSL